MLTDVMEYYKLKRGFRGIGFDDAFETDHVFKLIKELKNSISQGSLVVISGIAGTGKSTAVKVLRRKLIDENKITVCRSLSLEKEKINLRTLTTALFGDLLSGKNMKIPAQPELRERILCDLIDKKKSSLVLFIDEAHDLSIKALKDLKRLIETIRENTRGKLSIVLIGHPKLRNNLRRSAMEEVGARTEIYDINGMTLEDRVAFIKWLVKNCTDKAKKANVSDLVDQKAIELLAEKTISPLQIEQYLELSFLEAYKAGGNKVDTEIIDLVISKDINDIEPTLSRLGYNAKAIADVLNIRPNEAKLFMRGKVSGSRHEEIRDGLLAVGIPL